MRRSRIFLVKVKAITYISWKDISMISTGSGRYLVDTEQPVCGWKRFVGVANLLSKSSTGSWKLRQRQWKLAWIWKRTEETSWLNKGRRRGMFVAYYVRGRAAGPSPLSGSALFLFLIVRAIQTCTEKSREGNFLDGEICGSISE